MPRFSAVSSLGVLTLALAAMPVLAGITPKTHSPISTPAPTSTMTPVQINAPPARYAITVDGASYGDPTNIREDIACMSGVTSASCPYGPPPKGNNTNVYIVAFNGQAGSQINSWNSSRDGRTVTLDMWNAAHTGGDEVVLTGAYPMGETSMGGGTSISLTFQSFTRTPLGSGQ